ncbi:bifunctional pyr operon transcriptional regulator/uracil phosphoribosyltransferase PyrR [Sulfuricystis multivorans]|uniref:bifunctional pyr operon transcriptional regulator/uracil phosphoribosyltransferase PyrR n=1 Tax=Sulfuricystis multivorans TaxID=2211108 RepID=UPI0024E016DD|nr:bifunctional pyr operon transcriptional regulator/uracil phosphoribosyltransferase PyrR [Sulfuricystis multivorans]
MTIPPVPELIDRLAGQMRPAITAETVLVGIHTGGAWVAEALHATLGLATPLATIDVSFHRDDHHLGSGLRAGGRVSHLPENVEGAHLILVDDVLYTGRTVRAALNELFDYGRPGRVDLAVLVDRGGRELPIAPTWCAFVLPEPLPAIESLDLMRDADGQMRFRPGKK